jgi:hypothetical protein
MAAAYLKAERNNLFSDFQLIFEVMVPSTASPLNIGSGESGVYLPIRIQAFRPTPSCKVSAISITGSFSSRNNCSDKR